MATQTLEFSYDTGKTLTAKLFAIGNDTVVATASSVIEATNRKTRYIAAFADVPAGAYLLIWFESGVGKGSECYTLTAEALAFHPWSEQNSEVLLRNLIGAILPPGVKYQDALTGRNLPPLQIGYDWSIPVSFGDTTGYTRLVFTLKGDPGSEDDKQAIIQVIKEPATASYAGLKVLNGSVSASTAGAEIEITNASTGAGFVKVKADVTRKIRPAMYAAWDTKRVIGTAMPPTVDYGRVDIFRPGTIGDGS